MKEKITNSFKNFGFIWTLIMLTLMFCPYLFITFPLYLVVIIGHSISFYNVFENNDYKNGYTFKSKLVLLILSLLMMIFISYIAFDLSPSFKVFTHVK